MSVKTMHPSGLEDVPIDVTGFLCQQQSCGSDCSMHFQKVTCIAPVDGAVLCFVAMHYYKQYTLVPGIKTNKTHLTFCYSMSSQFDNSEVSFSYSSLDVVKPHPYLSLRSLRHDHLSSLIFKVPAVFVSIGNVIPFVIKIVQSFSTSHGGDYKKTRPVCDVGDDVNLV